MKTNHNIIALAINSAIALTLTGGLHAATKTVKAGNSMFGATATATMSYSAPSQSGYCNLYSAGKVEGKVLYKSVTLGSGNSNFRLTEGSGRTRSWGNLKVGTVTLASWDRTLTGSGSFSTAPFVIARQGGSIDLWKFLTVKAEASIEIRADGKVSVTTPAGGKPTVSAWAGPVIDATATGKLSILNAVGIDGKLTLCKGSFMTTGKMTPSTAAREFNVSNVDYSLLFTMQATRGKISVWANVPFLGKQYKDLADFSGLNKTYTLASGSFKLKAAPVAILH